MKNEHQDELLSMLIFRHEERAREETDIGERKKRFQTSQTDAETI